MPRLFPDLTPEQHRPHALHDSARLWPQTNCYVDLLIEVIASRGLPPEALFGFTVTQDFEGDQFGFFKPPPDDLETMFGLRIGELAIFDRLEAHLATQVAAARLPLVEVDGFYLPDTRGLTYGLAHSKTTIGILDIDPAAGRLVYFHNEGLFALVGEDYRGVLGLLPQQQRPDALFPYVELVRFGEPAPAAELPRLALATLRRHFGRRPAANPIAAFAAAFPCDLAALAMRDPAWFHVYAFNTLRQLGANFELLASHLGWLDARAGLRTDAARDAALEIAADARTMQFQLARAAARRRTDGEWPQLQRMAAAHDRLMVEVGSIVGMPAAPLLAAE